MKNLIYTLAFAHLVFIAEAQQPKLHVFIIGENNKPDISKAMDKNYYNASSFFSSLSNVLKFNFIEHNFYGSNFNTEGLQKAVNSLTFNSDDAVIVYYSSTYLSSFLGIDSLSKRLPLYLLHSKIRSKNPKNLITIVDSPGKSNSSYNSRIITAQETFLQEIFSVSTKVNDLINAPLIKNVKCLFKEKFDIIISSCQYNTTNIINSQGSLFTNYFIRAFKETIYSTNSKLVNWETILEKTRNYTFSTSSLYKFPYSPVWEINYSSYISPVTPFVTDTKFYSTTKKKFRNPFKDQYYEVQLYIKSKMPVDSVTYYLHYSLPTPIYTATTNNFKIKSSSKLFLYSFSVKKKFPVKAKIFYPDGRTEEAYNEIK